MGKGGEVAASLVLPEDSKELLSGPSYAATKLAPSEEWITGLDVAAFGKECEDLGKQLSKNQGPADAAHLQKIIWWSRSCQWLGCLLVAVASRLGGLSRGVVTFLAAFLLSTGTMTRWTIIGHHVCHGGFDKCSSYSRFKFGVGSAYRRAVDWLDWMLVEAWNVEHNQLHHYHLGEVEDPDLVEVNMVYLRELKVPKFVKQLFVLLLLAPTWKWWYYAPNTYKHLKVTERRKKGLPEFPDAHRTQVFDFAWLLGGGDQTFFRSSEFLTRCLLPYFVQRFLLLPLPFLLAGAYTQAVGTLLLAEAFTNWHSFLCIVTNHAGDDLYRFEKHCKPRSPTFYLRQVISSANFHCGYDLLDFLQGFLNYQIEHHMWPDLSMLSYRKAQPIVKAICAKHGVPYVQHNVFYRLYKTVDIMVGPTVMRKFPTAYDRDLDLSE
mmetsp:Transcript_29802/g.91257  ORF Transcript_29802/g.91257 Transcript_29802/m.91257 type:complete len:434 (+) Transcript_29802:76-1377(+)